ncbi:MAG: chorismate synthase [Erysipelotrichaceae bacterium]|nr:chorismate synthase [Erysipelotrichaceae bacterium]
MKNVFGNCVTMTLFGESHGEKIGVVIDGLSPGIKVDEEKINHQLSLRKPQGKLSTARVEEDKPEIVSGVFNGYTTGTPICILISNSNTKSKDYSKTRYIARPGHADYTAYEKYHGYEDYRGGGHFSGRLTTAIVAAGAIFLSALEEKGIKIGSHISKCMDIEDASFTDYEKDIDTLSNKLFAALSDEAENRMKEYILKASEEKDSIGGIIETAIVNMPKGVGEPFFDSIESRLSHALFSIPGIKGVEFGMGFEMAKHYGSEVNDSFRIKDEEIVTDTNNNAGINGGISNGMPIVLKCVVKPTPSIYKKQKSVDFKEMKEEDIEIEGRHDPAIFPRARVVIDSMCAMVMCDLLIERYGTDYFGE